MATDSVSSKLKSFKGSMSQEDLALHRQSFIHFSKNLAANCPDVVASRSDGKKIKGVYNTMTPFPGNDFKLCIKASRSAVRILFNEAYSSS